MFHKSRSQIIVALGTSCALLAFAVYKRHGELPLSTTAFFIAAATICIAPAVYGFLRHRIYCQK